MTLISSEDSAHDFIVKFSPSVCVAVVASFTREWLYEVLLTMLMEEILLLSMVLTKQCMLTQVRPPFPDDNHLTSTSACVQVC